jgi:hypothetical protein
MYNPTTAPVPQHFTPTPMMTNQQFVHGMFFSKINHFYLSLYSGHQSSAPPPTDHSSVPPAYPPVASYQDFKPANAWNDPPTVLMKTQKPNPAKVNIVFII